MAMQMKLSFLGGAMEVGGSCIYLRVGKWGILMDSGIRQSAQKDALPDFAFVQAAGGVDAILVSHAHMDHIGSLPIISKAYPNARIYMTPMTEDLSRVLLYDSLKIMGKWEEEIPHYFEQDVVDMFSRVIPVRFQKPMEILEGITVTCYPAGHVAGAACINLETPEGTLFYSGDFSSFAQRSIEGARVPKLRPDVAILESTYGNRLHANRQVEENRLVDLVADCIEEGRKILIPAFALGRSQEVLLILADAIRNGRIPKIPVYVDGMVRDINRMYTRNPNDLRSSLARKINKGMEPFYTEEIQEVAVRANRQDLASQPGAAIFVASSGMLTGGPSMVYAQKIAPMENACIILTGYQDEESPGRALLNLLKPEEEKAIVLNGIRVPVNCRVELVGLSAHADKSEIMALAEQIGARRIILVHGDEEAISGLGLELAADITRTVSVPRCGETIDFSFDRVRKQKRREMPVHMGKEYAFIKEEAENLWNFWNQNYQGRAMTLDDAWTMWSGEKNASEEVLQAFGDVLLETRFFRRNPRRMYMLMPASAEEIAKAEEKDSVLSPQEVEASIREQLKELEDPYLRTPKKFGAYIAEMRMVLNYDFPLRAKIPAMDAALERVQGQTGWRIEIGDSMNFQAASLLLQQLFGSRLGKISTYREKQYFQITLMLQEEGDLQRMEQFYRETGWQVKIKGQDGPPAMEKTLAEREEMQSKLMKIPRGNAPSMEQNRIFGMIDACFAAEAERPKKRGLKRDQTGAYIELSFLSPEQGLRYQETIQELADKTGMRIGIASTYNQILLCTEVQRLCLEQQIMLRKNPSWTPADHSILLSVADHTPSEKLAAVREQMERLYGVTVGCK